MLKVLVPVDGSEHALRAVEHVLRLRDAAGGLEVHLLSVQIPVASGHARLFVSHEQLEDYYREEGQQALSAARARFDAAGLPHTWHIAVGHVAETIAEYARELGVDQIVMGTHGRSALGHVLLGSVAAEVIRLAGVPVTLVR